ncbi:MULTISPECIES: PEP-CTERM domain protein [unclassified Sphingomonas]|uniref:PEP-CTERM domain protein n=1 Tax=unclassified Sphingomonas TaxID=196159 RepID=UPI000288472B|nr:MULTISPECIES: PEP-CTERM domain protein [unclassified Sphingomonas]
MKTVFALTAAIAALSSTQASAAQFNFSFDTTSTLFGGPAQTVRGIFNTSDTAVQRDGQTALAITGISGMINDVAISGLFDAPGNPTYYYFTTGPTFLDGSGVRFNAGAASNIAFFHQDGVSADVYRINGNGTISAFGSASSSAVVAAAVPEAATWAMMIAGFGMTGAAMRTRRRNTRMTLA